MTRPTFIAAANDSQNFSATNTLSISAGSSSGRGVWGFAAAFNRSGGGFSSITSVTVNGVACTLSSAFQFSGVSPPIYGKAFWLSGDANIPTGTVSVVVNYDDNFSKVAALVMTFSGVGASSPFGTPVTAQSLANNTPSWTVSSTTNSTIIGAALTYPNGTSGWAATAPASLASSLESANHSGVALYQDGAAVTTTIAGSKTGTVAGWFGIAASIDGAADPSDISGNVTLDDIVGAGTLGSSSSDLGGNVTLSDVVAAGTLGATPAGWSIPALTNWSGTLQASVTIPVVTFQRLSDGVQVLVLTSQTTNGAGTLSGTSGSLLTGTTYMACGWNADGSQRFAVPVTAT